MRSPIVYNIWSTNLVTNGKKIENNHYSCCQLQELVFLLCLVISVLFTFPNGLLLEQQGWKFVSSKYKWLENAHQARFGSNWLLWNGKNQLKKKIAEKKFFLEIFWTTRDCMEFQSRVITWPCGIVWIFNPWWSKNFQKFFFSAIFCFFF